MNDMNGLDAKASGPMSCLVWVVGSAAAIAQALEGYSKICTIDLARAIEVSRTSGLWFRHDVHVAVVILQSRFVVTDNTHHLAFGGVGEITGKHAVGGCSEIDGAAVDECRANVLCSSLVEDKQLREPGFLAMKDFKSSVPCLEDMGWRPVGPGMFRITA